MSRRPRKPNPRYATLSSNRKSAIATEKYPIQEVYVSEDIVNIYDEPNKGKWLLEDANPENFQLQSDIKVEYTIEFLSDVAKEPESVVVCPISNARQDSSQNLRETAPQLSNTCSGTNDENLVSQRYNNYYAGNATKATTNVETQTNDPRLIGCSCGEGRAPKYTADAQTQTDKDSDDEPPQTTNQYGCETCGKYFARNYGLQRHIERVHTRELPNMRQPAPVGTRKKTSKTSKSSKISKTSKKRKPIKIMDREKYRCEICCLSFVRNHGLQRHKDRVHTKWLFSCTHCTKTFAHKENLQRHINFVCRRN